MHGGTNIALVLVPQPEQSRYDFNASMTAFSNASLASDSEEDILRSTAETDKTR